MPRDVTYIIVLLGTFAVLALASLLFIGEGIRGDALDPSQYALLHNRLNKLAHLEGGIVMLGDSSLGNSVDETLFSSLTGQPAHNLALTGSFGYAGSYNLLRRAYKNHGVRVFLIMNTLEMMQRDIAQTGEVLTRPPGERSGYETLQLGLHNYGIETLWRIIKRRINKPAAAYFSFENDYIPQRTGADSQKWTAKPWVLEKSAIKPGKTLYLRKILAYCKAHDLVCLFAHGPYWEDVCKTSRSYIEDVASIFRHENAILINPQPFCLAAKKLGDTPDHINPRLKEKSTKWYAELVKPYLANGP